MKVWDILPATNLLYPTVQKSYVKYFWKFLKIWTTALAIIWHPNQLFIRGTTLVVKVT